VQAPGALVREPLRGALHPPARAQPHLHDDDRHDGGEDDGLDDELHVLTVAPNGLRRQGEGAPSATPSAALSQRSGREVPP
jgi:hypothetical protein